MNTELEAKLIEKQARRAELNAQALEAQDRAIGAQKALVDGTGRAAEAAQVSQEVKTIQEAVSLIDAEIGDLAAQVTAAEKSKKNVQAIKQATGELKAATQAAAEFWAAIEEADTVIRQVIERASEARDRTVRHFGAYRATRFTEPTIAELSDPEVAKAAELHRSQYGHGGLHEQLLEVENFPTTDFAIHWRSRGAKYESGQLLADLMSKKVKA